MHPSGSHGLSGNVQKVTTAVECFCIRSARTCVVTLHALCTVNAGSHLDVCIHLVHALIRADVASAGGVQRKLMT